MVHVCRYLYFDVQRAVELLGGEALSQAKAAAGNVTFVDHSSDPDKIPFCLGLPPLSPPVTPSTQAASNSSNDNQTQPVVTNTNFLVVSSASDEVTKELLKADPVSNLLTGGGTCR